MLDRGDLVQWSDGEVEANGITLHYYRTGDGTKPTLILSHGFTDNGLCWAPVARALESDYDVIMVDARGHGLSDAPESGYTTEDRADDLAGLVRALDLEKPAVLGHSMGGSTAAAAGAKYPDLFGKLLLEDPGWWDSDSERVEMTEAERQAWVEQRRAAMIERKQMSRDALMARCRKESPTWSEAEIGPWAIAKQQLSPYIVDVIGGKPRSWREDVKGLASPTLLIIADNEKGGIVTPEMAEEAKALNDLVEVVQIDAGHSVRREAFDAYMEAVRDFLAS
jgi:pimeloyl-ACP methyl ester carboxylesterase